MGGRTVYTVVLRCCTAVLVGSTTGTPVSRTAILLLTSDLPQLGQTRFLLYRYCCPVLYGCTVPVLYCTSTPYCTQQEYRGTVHSTLYGCTVVCCPFVNMSSQCTDRASDGWLTGTMGRSYETQQWVAGSLRIELATFWSWLHAKQWVAGSIMFSKGT